MRVVVCDDDVTLRGLLSSLLEEGGDEVIAESDNEMEVLELVGRFRPDVLLLDHAIHIGTGLGVVAAIAADPSLSCRIVLFTSFVEPSQISEYPNVTLVDKPNFDRLKAVLDELRATGDIAEPAAVDRRRPPTRPIDYVPGQGDDDDPLKFFAVLGDAKPGDTLLMLSVTAPDPDVLGAIAAEGRRTIRAQDWLVLRPKFVAMLLVGGTEDAGRSVLARIQRTWEATPFAERDLRSSSAILGDDDMPSDVFLALAAEVSS
jgi:CheY-like chemotaxis protein